MSSTMVAEEASLVENVIQEDAHEEQFEADHVSAVEGPNAGGRSSFWRGLFRRRQLMRAGDEKLEDESLLNSCPDLDYYNSRRGEDEDLDDYRDDGGALGGSLPSARRSFLSEEDSSDGDDDEDEDEDKDKDEDELRLEQSMSHSLLASGDDDDEADDDVHHPDLMNMHASEPILRYNPKNVVQYGDEESNDDEEDDDDSSDSGDEESEEEGDELEGVAPLPRPTPRQSLNRSQSVSSYSDNYDNDENMVDANNRKNIHGRIEGFGSKMTPDDPSSPMMSPRGFRQRMKEFTSNYRMRKMSIGTEDSMQRTTWVERFDNAVDSVLPADPELDGYFDAFQVRGPPPKTKPTKTSPTRQLNSRLHGINQNQTSLGSMSYRRRKLGNMDDPAYIIFLECELQNKELEANSWKCRVKELETEVKRLNGESVEDEDDGSTASDSSNENMQEEGESEIEWQTGGVPEEGVLIEVEGTTREAKLETTSLEAPPSPLVQVESRATDEDTEESMFMMTHVPDGPNGDEHAPIIRRPPLPIEKSREEEPKEDIFFPILSSRKDEPETIWMDVNSVKSTAVDKRLTSIGNEDGGDIELSVSDESDDGESEENNDESDDEEEDDEEETVEPAKEGTLIELDATPSDTTTKASAAVTSTAVVSDDDAEENSSNDGDEVVVQAKEGTLLDLDDNGPAQTAALHPDHEGEAILIPMES